MWTWCRLLLVAAVVSCELGRTPVDVKRVFPDSLDAALAQAIAESDRARIEQLIKAGADPNARGDQGITMLHWALLNKSKVGLDALMAAKADPTAPDSSGATVIHLAALANDPVYLDVLLSHRADPNARNAVTGATPLVPALMGNRHVQFAKLLAAGAQPNLADRMGDTPLHEAAKINAFERVIDLLEAGADPLARNTRGATFQKYLYQTPVSIMSENGKRRRAAVVTWLRQHNIPVEETSNR